VFTGTPLEHAIRSNSINVPVPACPPGSDMELSFVFLGDEVFPLRNYRMRPYFGSVSPDKEVGYPYHIFSNIMFLVLGYYWHI